MNAKFFIIKRVASILLILFGVTIILFFMLHLAPGDPARILAGLDASPEVVQQIRHKYGLDKDLGTQLLIYLSNMVRLDLGTSIKYGVPVALIIMERLPNSVLLAAVSIALAAAIAIPLGMIAAHRAGSRLDHFVTVFTSVSAALPTFWTGLLLMLLFAVELKLLPAGGIGGPEHVILPAVTIAIPISAPIARVARNSALEIMNKSFIKLAISKGLSEAQVIRKHVLKNILIPVITLVGLQFGTVIRSAVITETVFAWPGIGKLLVDSISARDYPMVQGVVFVVALIYALINLGLDLTYLAIDPRIRHGGELM